MNRCSKCDAVIMGDSSMECENCVPRCCFLGCNNPMTHHIVDDDTPDGYTYSCQHHLDEMTGNGQAFEIYSEMA